MKDNNVILLEKFFKAGAHFGHQTSFWNPKMKRYIFTKHNGIHIINLEDTIKKFNLAVIELKKILANNGKILFVGTKDIVRLSIAETALKFKQFYINRRWLGGTLTNWKVLKKLVLELKNLEQEYNNNYFSNLTKKESLYKIKKMKKLQTYYNGIKNMTALPDALFIIDAKKEFAAINEAHKLNIPIFSIVDTDSNPDYIDYVIPANDDSFKAINLYLSFLEEQLIL